MGYLWILGCLRSMNKTFEDVTLENAIDIFQYFFFDILMK